MVLESQPKTRWMQTLYVREATHFPVLPIHPWDLFFNENCMACESQKLRGAIQHRRTFISHLKQLILIKSPRPFQSRKYGYREKILPFLGSSRTKAVLARLGFPYAGAGGPVWGWELKNSYFRPFFVKIRSFSTFGALNPPKCPNKPKKKRQCPFFV